MKHFTKNIVNFLIYAFFIAMIALVGYFFINPFWNNYPQNIINIPFEKLGTMGDFFGGMLNPIIGIITIIYVYKTYHVQQQLYLDQKNDLLKQQFDSKFFNMLQMNQEILSELEFKEFSGVKIFESIYFQMWFKLFSQMSLNLYGVANNLTDFEPDHLKPEFIERHANGKQELANLLIDLFSKFDVHSKNLLNNELLNYMQKHDFTKNQNAEDQEKLCQLIISNFSYENEIKLKTISEYTKKFTFLKMYGFLEQIYIHYAPYFGHYFRNLYHIIKYVDNQTILSEHEKTEYIQILRSKLSIYERIILFYGIAYINEFDHEAQFKHYAEQYALFKGLKEELLFSIKHKEFFKESAY